MDPQSIYDEVLEEEKAAGASDEAARAKAEAAAERARLGSPHPKEARFWVAEKGPEPVRRTAVETPTTSEPVDEEDIDEEPNPADPGVRSDQDIAPGVSSQPAAEDRPQDQAAATEAVAREEPVSSQGSGTGESPRQQSAEPSVVETQDSGEPRTADEAARLPSSQLVQAEEKPDDDFALQSQWESQSRIGDRRRLMAERRTEAEGLIDTGVPMVTAAEGTRASSPLVLALYVLVPLAAILIFVLGLSSGGADSAASTGGSAAPQNTLTDITVTAAGVAFDTKTITAAAGKTITVHFDNSDTVAHNMAFYDDTSAKKKIYVGSDVQAAATTDYSFKTPTKPGNYFFRCDIHPASMVGTFVIKKG